MSKNNANVNTRQLLLGATLMLLALYLAPLGVRPIAAIDEARYGEIPREMLSSGDWVTPRLNGLRYFEKPVAGYWLHAVSLSLFGLNAFALRLPSALAVAATAALVFLLARAGGWTRRASLLGAVVYATFAEVYVVGVTAVLDSLLTLFVTGVIVFLFLAWREERPARRALLLGGCGLFCSAAFMTKGFVAFAVPVLAFAPFLIWQNSWKRLFTMPWIPLLVAVALILPWALAIHAREPDFWTYFFWVEHINRFFPSTLLARLHESDFWRGMLGEEITARLLVRDSQHAEPFWFFIPVLIAGAMPWTFLLPSAAIGLRRTPARDPLLRLCICWFALPFIFLSTSSGKLGTYILPCFIPLALLTARGLISYLDNGGSRAWKHGALAAAGLAALIGAALAINYLTAWPEPIYGAGDGLAIGFLLAGILVFVAMSAATAGCAPANRRLALFACSPVVFFLLSHAALPRSLGVVESLEPFLKEHHARARNALVAADKHAAHSVCFFYERDDILIFDGLGEFEYGLNAGARHRLLATEPGSEESGATLLAHLVADPDRRAPLLIFVQTGHFNRRKELLMDLNPSFVDQRERTVLIQYD